MLQRCIPQFENAVFGLEAEATNTCGQNGPVEYCEITRGYEVCQWCNSSSQFSTFYMTDSLSDTWWQSETMFEGIQAPNHVNLTFHFGKSVVLRIFSYWQKFTILQHLIFNYKWNVIWVTTTQKYKAAIFSQILYIYIQYLSKIIATSVIVFIKLFYYVMHFCMFETG